MSNNSQNQFPEGTPLNFIQCWQSIKFDGGEIEKAFETTGNSFTMQTGNISHVFNTLHVYLGTDQETNKVVLFAVPGICDYVSHMKDEYKRYKVAKKIVKSGPGEGTRVNSKLEAISLFETDIQNKFNGKYTPAEEELIESIKNWNNPETRSTWVKNSCASLEGIVQVLVINISDFKIAYEHTCYLALKEVGDSYQMDLVVQNTTTGEFLNLIEVAGADGTTVSLRDMARPVPPFGDSVFTESPDQFGILDLMNE